MYYFILGYLLGLFTMIAWNLHKAGTIKLKLSQWILVAFILTVLTYISHKFIKFDLGLAEQSLGFSVEMFILPTAFILLLLVFFIYKAKRSKKTED